MRAMTTDADYPNLSNAPIQEAIISVTIGEHKHASVEATDAACTALAEANLYPNKKPWKGFEAAFEINEGGTMNASHREVSQGIVLSSEDQKNLLHVSNDTLTLNRLHPYGSWEEFSARYKQAWDIYTALLQIQAISSISIRYINNFTIPTTDWEQYLLMRPALQSSCDIDSSIMAMTESFSRYALSSERHIANAVVLLTIKCETPAILRIIMDIEVQSRAGIQDYPGYHAIIDTLNRLRDFKNQIFFSNLPKAKELFS